MTTDSEYLTTLPAPIQEQLVAIVRASAGMGTDEKRAGHSLIQTFAAASRGANYSAEWIPILIMIGRLGVLVELVAELANQEVA